MFIVQVNDKDGILNELVSIHKDRGPASRSFLETCEARLSNWDEYSASDVGVVLDDGYCKFGTGVVMFIDTDGVTSDDEITAMMGNCPPKSVEKITRWVQDGEIGTVDTISEVIERAGSCLDAACSHDICGPILFQAEDKRWYSGTVELVISQAHPEWVKDCIAEEGDAQ